MFLPGNGYFEFKHIHCVLQVHSRVGKHHLQQTVTSAFVDPCCVQACQDTNCIFPIAMQNVVGCCKYCKSHGVSPLPTFFSNLQRFENSLSALEGQGLYANFIMDVNKAVHGWSNLRHPLQERLAAPMVELAILGRRSGEVLRQAADMVTCVLLYIVLN